MTEYHARYGGNCVMIYWHVERTTSASMDKRLDLELAAASSRPGTPAG